MENKPYYRHCGNCEHCVTGIIHDYICIVKRTKSDRGRLRALFCKFFKMRGSCDE